MKNVKECTICKRRAKRNTDIDGEEYCRKHYNMIKGYNGVARGMRIKVEVKK